MKKTATALLTVIATAALVGTAIAGPWFAKGDYYCGPGCWNNDGGNEMFDDGLHGDGAAGDLVFAGTVVADQAGGRKEFKIALADWSESYYPWCNLWVHIAGPGDPVKFTLDRNTYSDGWLPASNIVWSDHFAPPGTTFEVIGGAPETGGWTSGVAASLTGCVWSKTVNVAAPGSYEAKFRATGTWDVCNIGSEGAAAPCGANLAYTTTMANSDVLFEFDQCTGRARVTVGNPTPTKARSWGELKTLYR